MVLHLHAGHINFNDEVSAAMRLADGVLLVVDAAEGVMMVTDKVIKQAVAEGLPICLLLSKVRAQSAAHMLTCMRPFHSPSPRSPAASGGLAESMAVVMRSASMPWLMALLCARFSQRCNSRQPTWLTQPNGTAHRIHHDPSRQCLALLGTQCW